jgi:hypothetical protein
MIIITSHAVHRFKERITKASRTAVEKFIRDDLKKGELLYSINGVEKWRRNEITYVLEREGVQATVVTLYFH